MFNVNSLYVFVVFYAMFGHMSCFVGFFCIARSQSIEGKLRILLQMSVIITWTSFMPVVRIGRMAGVAMFAIYYAVCCVVIFILFFYVPSHQANMLNHVQVTLSSALTE